MPPIDIKKIALTAVVAALLIVLFSILLFQPKTAAIKKLNVRHAEVTKLLDTSRGYVSKYKSVRAAVDSMSIVWASLAECLPDEEEMPRLLRGIAEAGRLSNVQFVLFKPLSLVPTGFYVQNPVQIRVNCSYHELGYFLSKISSLERLVNVSKFKLITNKKPEKYASVEFTATAYTIPDSLLPSQRPEGQAAEAKPAEKK